MPPATLPCLSWPACCNCHRGKLRRSVKVGWWVGHSYGRYAGSTWYCDTFFNDLRKNCVGYMDIDSPGVKGATDLRRDHLHG